jgi:sporulation protein YlmC with PRC-barrel domain
MSYSASSGSGTLGDKETGSLIAASKVEGTNVYNRAGDSLGSISDVMIDKRSGQVKSAAMEPVILQRAIRRLCRQSR